MGEGECEPVEVSKKGRHRKKQLYSSILHQMEFYFSDSNLSKDRFLSQLITQDSYVDLSVFLTFNNIKKLNCTIDDIRKAIRKSELIELSEDKEKVHRKVAPQVKENVDECTIYVENIKPDANHEWVRQVFSDFGNVVYVSIPKYSHNKKSKGFAFVEFETEKDAQNVLSYFENIGCKMPSETDPEELASIRTFEGDKKVQVKREFGKERSESGEQSKQSANEEGFVAPEGKPENENKVTTSRKRKLSDDENRIEKKLKTESDVEGNEKKEQSETNESEDVETKKKKKHKKDKKKTYIRELGLRILSKIDWKKLRNRYLGLQRKQMKEFKQYLYQQKFSTHNKTKAEVESKSESKPSKDDFSKLEYVPGVIVKLKVAEVCEDTRKLKSDIKATSSDIKYVDIPISATCQEAYLRFATAAAAEAFCSQDYPGEKALLQGDDERAYWEKIQTDRSNKFMKNAKKQRGRDRLLKKAEKQIAKHLKFDEGD